MGAGGWALVDGGLVNGDGRKRACGMRTIPGDTEIRVVSDGDDDSNSSTMTTTMRTWARAGGVVRAAAVEEEEMLAVCFASYACPVSFACKAKGKAGTSSSSRFAWSEGKADTQHQTNITDCCHWPLLLFYYGLPVYAPFRLHYYTARHGSSDAAAAAVVALIECFLHTPRHMLQSIPTDIPTMHCTSPLSMPVPQLTWQGVERYGRTSTYLLTLGRPPCHT